MVSEVAPIDLPLDYLVTERAGTENFPVASRVLPARVRADLMALYGWARLVDEIGDNLAGDRLAALDEVERQLLSALADGAGGGGDPAWSPGLGPQAGQGHGGGGPAWSPGLAPQAGQPLHPLVDQVAESVRRLGLPAQPLLDLVEANRQDQRVFRYETFADLVGYCRLSADPVGRMVLEIFGTSTPERVAWSDKICTALQLVEHWQDVAEDAVVGRVYVPQEDLRRFGVAEDQLLPPPAGDSERGGKRRRASANCRALMAFEASRARRMLDEGSPLVASLRGRLRVAVAGFVAGGHAALDALGAADFDIYADTPRPAPRCFTRHLVSLLIDATTSRPASEAGRRTIGKLSQQEPAS